MKSKILFFTLLVLMYSVSKINAQKPVYPKPNGSDQIPFGKKLPPPVFNAKVEKTEKPYKGLPYTSFDTVSKQFIVHTPGQRNVQDLSFNHSSNAGRMQNASKPKPIPSGFHLTKDINTTSV